MTDQPFDIDDSELRKYLELFQPKVTKELEIVDYKDIDHPLYHIATTKQKELVPNISGRAALSEDNTIPRVYTSPYLLGCILSVEHSVHQALNKIPYQKTEERSNKSYKGGYYIHSVKWRKSLKPSSKLVYDARKTSEHWLVAYNKMLKSYPSEIIGKFFISSINFIPRTGMFPLEEAVYLLEITDKSGVWLTKDKFLPSGYWRFVIRDDRLFEVKPSDKESFENAKLYSAAMLSYQEETTKPLSPSKAFLRW